jgi:hypothetical protein
MFTARHHLMSLISDLEKDIRENPDRRQTELAALKTALAAIDGVAQPEASARPAAPPKVREGTKKDRFRALVNALIGTSALKRVHRSEIISQCKLADLFPGTADLDRDVSKYLSLDGTFAPDGEGYWKRKGVLDLGPNEIRPQGANPAT